MCVMTAMTKHQTHEFMNMLCAQVIEGQSGIRSAVEALARQLRALRGVLEEQKAAAAGRGGRRKNKQVRVRMYMCAYMCACMYVCVCRCLWCNDYAVLCSVLRCCAIL